MSTDKPSTKPPSAFVDQAYSLDTAEDTVNFYRNWAADYDHQMLDLLGYISPASIAEILAEHLPDREASILDVGCGTGLTCRVLAERGYRNLDGIDLSSEMLEVAGERGIYRDLLQADNGVESLRRGNFIGHLHPWTRWAGTTTGYLPGFKTRRSARLHRTPGFMAEHGIRSRIQCSSRSGCGDPGQRRARQFLQGQASRRFVLRVPQILAGIL